MLCGICFEFFNNLKHRKTKAVKNICMQEKVIPWLAALIGFQTTWSWLKQYNLT